MLHNKYKMKVWRNTAKSYLYSIIHPISLHCPISINYAYVLKINTVPTKHALFHAFKGKKSLCRPGQALKVPGG
jgi:hypothetical protein